MSAHPVAASLARGFAAFAAGDLAALETVFAPDATWTIRGRSPLAGTYVGLAEIVAMLRRTAELTGGTYRTEPSWLLADDERAVAVYRARGSRNGRELDLEQSLLCRVEEGRIAAVLALPLDQAVFDAFWTV